MIKRRYFGSRRECLVYLIVISAYNQTCPALTCYDWPDISRIVGDLHGPGNLHQLHASPAARGSRSASRGSGCDRWKTRSIDIKIQFFIARLENINLNIIQPINILLRLYPSLPGVEGARALPPLAASPTRKHFAQIFIDHLESQYQFAPRGWAIEYLLFPSVIALFCLGGRPMVLEKGADEYDMKT